VSIVSKTKKKTHTHTKDMPNVSHCFDEEENEEKL